MSGTIPSKGRPSRRVPGEAVPVSALSMPRGWFAVATSASLAPGVVSSARVAGEDLVVWRTEGGAAGAATAWCPHLGAHLGEVGRVRGELLECGFHGFCYDLGGRCVATGYGGRVPSRATARAWKLRETGGVVFAWFDPGRAPPSFELPDIDGAGWTSVSWWSCEFSGHPLDVTENSVDIGHLAFLHGYDDVGVLEPPCADGPVLTAAYQMTRGRRASGVRLPTMRTHFAVTVLGLGVSLVDLTVETLGVRQRLFVLPTPLGDGIVHLRLGVSGHLDLRASAPWFLRALPAGAVARTLREFTLIGLRGDVAQDRRIWQTKRHVPHPVLAEGDGPIGTYRAWAAQFMIDPGAAAPDGPRSLGTAPPVAVGGPRAGGTEVSGAR
ncbi:MAG: Rieske 2Fe-2S domain-containing protein [Acidimicrobiales bacterium]